MAQYSFYKTLVIRPHRAGFFTRGIHGDCDVIAARLDQTGCFELESLEIAFVGACWFPIDLHFREVIHTVKDQECTVVGTQLLTEIEIAFKAYPAVEVWQAVQVPVRWHRHSA